jgi:hypothetical protein
VEIKSSMTLSGSLFEGLDWWVGLTGKPPESTGLVYAGDAQRTRKGVAALPWFAVQTYLVARSSE